MILLTGANGHLGANLARRLLKDGATMRVLLRRASDNSTVEGLAVERAYGDLRDPASLLAACRGCDAIYHCAAQLSTVAGGEQQLFANNVLGTRNLLDAAAKNGVRRVVVSGSLSATGHRWEGPTDETEPFDPFEEHLPYARTKAAVEHECLKAVAGGLDVVIAVSCAILGPNDFKPSRMGQLLLNYAHGRLRAYVPGGFEFVAAADIVEGHLLAMTHGRSGEKYIFSTQFMTVSDLLALYGEVTGRPNHALCVPAALLEPVARIGEFAHRHLKIGGRQLLTPAAIRLLRLERRADCSKARSELGYHSGSIADAVRDAYDGFVSRGLIERRQSFAVRSLESERTKA
ncbi:NAD-dependent epimerase/dehydratase family protein [Bradyrhizobium diazoefficiens]|uniref:NAD-dependent epimerase/dehydratase family protein n=1 Tax=Bradyrhizobium diazoefficiens TaxID=1355477 RepID=UPI00359AC7ED